MNTIKKTNILISLILFSFLINHHVFSQDCANGSTAMCSTFGSQTVKTSIPPGSTTTVSIQYKNTGMEIWGAGNVILKYLDVKMQPSINNPWGIDNIPIPINVSRNMSATFTFKIQAPATPGIYWFQWQTATKDSVLFGQSSPAVEIKVE